MRNVHLLGVFAALVACSDTDKPPPGGQQTQLAAPTGVEAVPGDGRITLQWNASDRATQYEVHRSTQAGGPRTELAAPEATSYVDAPLVNGTTYYYVVRAVNSAANSAEKSAFSSEVNATPRASTTPPAAPANLRATAGDGEILLEWDAVADASSYRIFRDPGCAGTFQQLAEPTATSYRDAGLTNGTTYCYRALATNSAGAGDPSEIVRATPEGTISPDAPPPPVDLTAEGGDGQVTLSWSASPRATGYVVERAFTRGGTYVEVGSPEQPAFIDSGLTNSTTHYYVVRARNDAGRSARSSEVSATPASGRELCVSDERSHTISVFDLTASGDVLPLRRLGDLTQMEQLKAIAIDPMRDEIYVANTRASATASTDQWSVLVYARGADGNIAPIRFLGGANTQLSGAHDLALDLVNDELYVSSEGRVHVFPRDVSGDVAPLRTLNFSTLPNAAPAIAVDPLHDELFLAHAGALYVHARNAQGNAMPVRTVSGSSSMLDDVVSIAYDAANDQLAVLDSYDDILFFPRTGTVRTREILYSFAADLTEVKNIAADGTGGVYVSCAQGVVYFDASAQGGALPSRTIAGANVGFAAPTGVAIDVARGELIIADPTPAARGIVTHNAATNGDTAPSSAISGRTSGVRAPVSIAAAISSGTLVVANAANAANAVIPSVASFATPWMNTPLPASVLAGASTALSSPSAIAIDETNGETFVANRGGADATVTVHAIGADGDVPPLRTLILDDFVEPSAIAVDGELYVALADGQIRVYARDARDRAAPLRSFSASTYYGVPSAIAIDATNDELAIAGEVDGASAIAIFPRATSAGRAPLRRIAGASTRLLAISAMIVEPSRGELIVTDSEARAIVVHALAADGDVAPLRVISGASTELARPSGVASCK